MKKTVSLTAPINPKNAQLTRIERVVSAVLRRHPGLEVVDAGAATPLAITIPADQPKAVAPVAGPVTGPPVAQQPPATAAAHVLAFFAEQLQLPPNEFTTTNTVAVDKYADAVATGSLRSLQAAIDADPAFVPALRLGVEMFSAGGEQDRAIAAAERLLAISPAEHALRKDLIRWLTSTGRSAEAVPHLGSLLAVDPNNTDALFTIARLSLSALDADRFRRTSSRYQAITHISLFHEPDLLLAQGRIDHAVKMYYDLERADPTNASLALTIGRIAVLRHSTAMADLELAKLQKLDPNYGYPLLRAYVAAEKKSAAEAERQLNVAQLGATWKDEPFTASGEVYAILNQPGKAIEAFRIAAQRGEGTLTYILTNPLFRYLESEDEYRVLKQSLETQRQQLRARLAELRL